MSFRDVQAATEAAIPNAHAARLLAYLAKRTNVGDAEHYCGRYQVRDIVEDYVKSGHQRSERAIRGDLAYLRKWPAIKTKIAKCQKTGHDRGLLIWLLLPFTPPAPGAPSSSDEPAPECSLMGDVNLHGCAYPETNKEQDSNKEHLEQNKTASGFEDSPVAITTSSGADQEPGKIEDSEQDLLKSCAKKGSDAKPCAHPPEPIAPTHLTPRRVFDHVKALIVHHHHVEDLTPWTAAAAEQISHVISAFRHAPVDMWTIIDTVVADWKPFRAFMRHQHGTAWVKAKFPVSPNVEFVMGQPASLWGFYDLPAYQREAYATTGKPYKPKDTEL
jgi:hypothetical protein